MHRHLPRLPTVAFSAPTLDAFARLRCPTCAGGGRLWAQPSHTALPQPSAGTLRPCPCPSCLGAGAVPAPLVGRGRTDPAP